MAFTIHADRPNGDHSKFIRSTVVGAVFKAADLMGNGWTRVHICDETNQIYWPDRFDQLSTMSKPNAPTPASEA
jgi:hypothetical protein